MTSQSFEGRDFPDFEMLDAKRAFALNKNYLLPAFPKKSQCRRAARSKARQISAWSVTTFEQPELMVQHKTYEIFSMLTYKEVTFKLLTQDLIELFSSASEIPT